RQSTTWGELTMAVAVKQIPQLKNRITADIWTAAGGTSKRPDNFLELYKYMKSSVRNQTEGTLSQAETAQGLHVFISYNAWKHAGRSGPATDALLRWFVGWFRSLSEPSPAHGIWVESFKKSHKSIRWIGELVDHEKPSLVGTRSLTETAEAKPMPSAQDRT